MFLRGGQGDGFVHFGLAGGEAAAFARLYDKRAVDELRENMAAQFVFRRPLRGGDAAFGFGQCAFELAHGDDVVARHGGDAVHVFDVGGKGRLKGGGK